MENTNTLPIQLSTDKLVEIVQTAPAILNDNKTRHDKAVNYGKNLIAKVEEFGMNDEIDSLLADYQAKLRVTYKTIQEARKPFTQIVDEVKKEFTALESDIDPAGKTNIFSDVQRLRNIYVTEKVEAQKKKEAELLRKQNIEKERIDIENKIDISIYESFSRYLAGVKRSMNNIFEGMKLDGGDSTRKMINAAPINLPESAFKGFGNIDQVYTNFLSVNDVDLIFKNKLTDNLFADLNDVCAVELMEYRRELIEKIPSKQKELEEIAAAGKEEAARLQKEADERKQREVERLAEEQLRKSQEASQALEVAAAGKALEVTINTQAELFTEAPKTKDGYLITVTHRAGYGLIFQFWFEKEGKDLTADKIEKKTIGQMKAFCENYAIKNDEKIKSPLLHYAQTYKAK